MKKLLFALLFVPLLGLPTIQAGDLQEIVFDALERQIIAQYYREHSSGRTGGNKKAKGGLPPGIARNLERGKALPPGISRQALPADLVAKLPPVREGHERVVVDGRVLLVDIATGIIRDKLEDVLLK